MQHVASRRNPLVATCRKLIRRTGSDLLLLDGLHLVSEALASNIRLRQVIISIAALSRPEIRTLLEAFRTRNIKIATASASVMGAISPVRSPSEIIAIAEAPAYSSDVLYAGRPLVVIATNTQDPGNIGAIIRVAEAGGATGVIAAGSSAHPLGWKALRGSMGSALRLPFVVREEVSQAVAEARQRGCQIVATVPRGGRSHVDVDLRRPTAIVIGGEGAGLDPSLVEAADVRVTIPMTYPVESLNAAVAAALLVYEARRQREAAIEDLNASRS